MPGVNVAVGAWVGDCHCCRRFSRSGGGGGGGGSGDGGGGPQASQNAGVHAGVWARVTGGFDTVGVALCRPQVHASVASRACVGGGHRVQSNADAQAVGGYTLQACATRMHACLLPRGRAVHVDERRAPPPFHTFNAREAPVLA